jgi:hypothetical protein
VGQVEQSRSPAYRRTQAAVPVLRARLDGVQANPQRHRCPRCTLKVEHARDRIRGSLECCYEAVAIPPGERLRTAVASDHVRQDRVEPSHGGRHPAPLRLGKPTGSIHADEQERHFAGLHFPSRVHVNPCDRQINNPITVSFPQSSL